MAPDDGSSLARAAIQSDAHVYRELRRLAASYLRRERAGHTLQPTALVHEAFVKLCESRSVDGDRGLLVQHMAQSMRRILVEHARKRAAGKRGGGAKRVTLSTGQPGADGPDFDALALDDALHELARHEPRPAKVVELRFFGGLTVDEIAALLGVSTRSIESDWTFARTWLHKRLA